MHTSIPRRPLEAHPRSTLPLLARRSLLLTVIALACFALSPPAGAQCPEGCDEQFNTSLGNGALASGSLGMNNTATGFFALRNNRADNNTASGYEALGNNTTGYQNTAVGASALEGSLDSNLFPNSTGSYNTAAGFESLFSVTNGAYNVAEGWHALYSNTTGYENTATGAIALYQNTIGTNNTADGYGALASNVGGHDNTAQGFWALLSSTGNNTLLGNAAGQNLTTGNNNVVIGAGVLGTPGDANITRIGKTTQKKTFIGGIRGITTKNTNAVPVVIDSAGQLGTVSSSQRFKEEIKPMDKCSEAILGLKPVTFHYKSDGTNTPQFGLIAEEVARINPNLVVRDDDGEIYTVRYEAVNAMLLNEFLKEHRKVQRQGDILQKQDVTIAELKKQVELLTVTVQKVSSRIELSKQSARVVANEP